MPGGAPPPVIAAQIASSSCARSGRGRAAVERGEQLQSGSVHRHRSGPVGRATGTVPCPAMSDMPELRDGPPWAMEEMIKAEPGLVAPILASPAALEAAESIREGGPVSIVGCGTSEHAAMAGARLLDGARARDAFEASLDPQDGGVLIAISHEAGTAATLAAMRAAADGARTILITAQAGATPAPTSSSARRSSTRRGATPSATSRRCWR